MTSQERPLRPRKSVFRYIWDAIGFAQSVVGKILFFIFLFIVLAVIGDMNKKPDVPSKGALVIAPEGVIVEQATQVKFGEGFPFASERPKQTVLQDVIDAIRLAKTDDRIQAVVLWLDKFAGAGPSKLHYLGRELDAFRESGKPVFAMGDNYINSSYLLAAQADTVLLNPGGAAIVTGYERYRTYMASLLEKLKVTVNLFSVGQYKSATEPFMRDDMSEPAKEANRAFLEALWTAYQRSAERHRSYGEGELETFINEVETRLAATGGDFAQAVHAAGIVDELGYKDQQRARIAQAVGMNAKTHTFNQVAMNDYLTAVRQKPKKSATQIAVVRAVGTIIDGEAPAGTIGGETLANHLRQALHDDTVKAVVLRVDSGGGSVFGSKKISREIDRLREAGKPVVASMGSVAASGGYWISMHTDEIWAAPTTITGSIGVFGLFPTFENTLGEIGVTEDGVGTTKLQALLNPLRPMTDTARNIFQQSVEQVYQEFVSTTAQRRGMTFDAVHAVAQGRVWIGTDALAHGLVDKLGYLDEAVAAAAEKAGLSAYTIKEIKHEIDPWDKFLQDLLEGMSISIGMGPSGLTDMLPQALRPAVKELTELEKLDDPRGLYMICGDCLVTE